ncbi:MAG: NAD(P)-dependent oxidoreductase [Endomicrobiaceae bacterium]|nr:NAD(P)-dependent oxidoreductase [Endomicrobiaceae bacterium]
MKKKILLTGGSGFIGRNILESFLIEKYDISHPSRQELNLTDYDCVKSYFKDKTFDVVLHSATKPGHRNAKDTKDLFSLNTGMFENLINHKDRYGKFINFGSGAIYDTSTNITDFKEENIFKNICQDEHGFCKYVVAKKIEQLENFIDLNIFGIFGKYEDWQIRFISNAVCKTLYDLPITLRQNRRFSYLFVDDLMPVLEFFIENDVKYKSYNIVPDEKIELLEIAELVKKISNKNIEIKVAKDGYGLDYTGNNSRLKTEFTDVNFTDVTKSISSLYEYYKNNISKIDRSLLLEDK